MIDFNDPCVRKQLADMDANMQKILAKPKVTTDTSTQLNDGQLEAFIRIFKLDIVFEWCERSSWWNNRRMSALDILHYDKSMWRHVRSTVQSCVKDFFNKTFVTGLDELACITDLGEFERACKLLRKEKRATERRTNNASRNNSQSLQRRRSKHTTM